MEIIGEVIGAEERTQQSEGSADDEVQESEIEKVYGVGNGTIAEERRDNDGNGEELSYKVDGTG